MPGNDFLESSLKLFEYYKSLGDKAMRQVPDQALFYQPNDASNSVAIIVKHLSGNMVSRWTDFLTTDGEKAWRDRDGEFTDTFSGRDELIQTWEKGWQCLLETIRALTVNDLKKTVYIRNEGHTVTEAINRQLAHVPYHIGQIVYIAKMTTDKKWETLTIARNASENYNLEKFKQDKGKRFFTDGRKKESSEEA
ncbi:DUF1572 family protein [Sinomicrobium sp. M5D2P17]